MKNIGEMSAGSSAIIVKVSYNGEIRKISFEGKTFAALYETISVLVGEPAIAVKYTDEEGDLITLSSDLELKAALNGRAQLNLYIESKAKVAVASAPPLVIFSNPSTSLLPELSSLRIDSNNNSAISYPSVAAPLPPPSPFAYSAVSAPVNVITPPSGITNDYVAAPEIISDPPVAPMIINASAPIAATTSVSQNGEGESNFAQRKQERKQVKELMKEERKLAKVERKEMKAALKGEKKSEKEKRKETKKEWKRKDKKAKISDSDSDTQSAVSADGAEPAVALSPVGGGLVDAKMAMVITDQVQEDSDKYAALVDAVLASGVRQKICDLLVKYEGDVTKVAEVFGKKAHRHEKKTAKKFAEAAKA